MSDDQMPAVGTRWRDTVGDDGVLEVVGSEEGFTVITDDSGDRFYLHPCHFGVRYVLEDPRGSQ